MFIGLWAGLPIFGLAIANISVSLVGLVRGPNALRARVTTWWLVVLGGLAVSSALAPSAEFNPYLGTPQPPFGLSDAVLLSSVSAAIVLPCVWLWRSGNEQG